MRNVSKYNNFFSNSDIFWNLKNKTKGVNIFRQICFWNSWTFIESWEQKLDNGTICQKHKQFLAIKKEQNWKQEYYLKLRAIFGKKVRTFKFMNKNFKNRLFIILWTIFWICDHFGQQKHNLKPNIFQKIRKFSKCKIFRKFEI